MEIVKSQHANAEFEQLQLMHEELCKLISVHLFLWHLNEIENVLFNCNSDIDQIASQ